MSCHRDCRLYLVASISSGSGTSSDYSQNSCRRKYHHWKLYIRYSTKKSQSAVKRFKTNLFFISACCSTFVLVLAIENDKGFRVRAFWLLTNNCFELFPKKNLWMSWTEKSKLPYSPRLTSSRFYKYINYNNNNINLYRAYYSILSAWCWCPGEDYSKPGQQHQNKEQFTCINKISKQKQKINMRNKHN